nr:MAG TPA: hypothetical protein [Caudoviricetes sp.]
MNGAGHRPTEKGTEMTRRMKAVIGYWTDYYVGKSETLAYFKINNQKVTVAHNMDGYYTIYYRWLVTDVMDEDIFETLDLYEQMLKGVN